MLTDLYNLLLSIPRVRAQRLGKLGTRIFLTYVRLKMTNRWLQWTGRKKTSEHFLGFQVNFVDYLGFVYLYEEIFIQGPYRFQTHKRAPLIFDCGSNIGISVLYFKALYPEARIVAFEPGPETFALLKSNLAQNNLKKVTLHNLALSDCEGSLVFHSGHSGSVVASIFAERTGSDIAATSVQCQTLSRFIDGPVDFMKMDIEGAEALCIPEASRSGRLRNIGEMAIECHHNLSEKSSLLTTVLSTLEADRFSFQLSSVVRPPLNQKVTQDVLVYAFPSEP
jgi:FkbM family methyltransferase